jgi:hypothetical protein
MKNYTNYLNEGNNLENCCPHCYSIGTYTDKFNQIRCTECKRLQYDINLPEQTSTQIKKFKEIE